MRLRQVFLIAALVGLAVLPTSAQTITTVTGQVLDPNGVPYGGARLSITLNNPGPGSPTYTPCHNPSAGCQIQNPGAVTLDAQGNIPGGGISLYANASILPAGTTYTFTVNETPGVLPPWGTGPQIFTLPNVTIAGPTQTLTSAFAAVPPPVLTLVGSATGGGSAQKPNVADGICYVTTEGASANDGLSWGTAKATINQCEAILPAGGGSIYMGSGTFPGASTLSKPTQLWCNAQHSPTILTIGTNVTLPEIDITASDTRVTQCLLIPAGQTAGSGIQIDGDAVDVEIDHNFIASAFGPGIFVPSGASDLSIHDNTVLSNGQASATDAQIKYVEPVNGQDAKISIFNNDIETGSPSENSCITFLASSSNSGGPTDIANLSLTNNFCLHGSSASFATYGISMLADPSVGNLEQFFQVNISGNQIASNEDASPDLSSGIRVSGNLFGTVISGNNIFGEDGDCIGVLGGPTSNTTGAPTTVSGNVCESNGPIEISGVGIVSTAVTGNTLYDPTNAEGAIYVHAGGPAVATATGTGTAVSVGPLANTHSAAWGMFGTVAPAASFPNATPGGSWTNFNGFFATSGFALYGQTLASPGSVTGTATWAPSTPWVGAMLLTTSTPTIVQHIQSVNGALASSGSNPFPITRTVTAGNAIMAILESDFSNQPTNGITISDNCGDHYQLLANVYNPTGNGSQIEIYLAQNITGGSCTVTPVANAPGSGDLAGSIDVSELNGLGSLQSGAGTIEQVAVTGNTINGTGTTTQPGIDFAAGVNNSSITSNIIYGAGASGTTNPAITLTSSSDNLVDGNTIVDYSGTPPGSIGVDITNAGATANCVGVNLFSGVTTPISDSGTSTGCPNTGAVGGSGVLVFGQTVLSANVPVTISTLTPITTVSVTMPAAGCPCRVLASYNLFIASSNAIIDTYVSDGTNIFATNENESSGTFQTSQQGSAISPVTYASGAAVTFTAFLEANKNLTVDAAPQIVGSNSYLQISVLRSN